MPFPHIRERIVPRAAGEERAKEFLAAFYGETSAESGEDINEIFTRIMEMDPAYESVQDSSRAGPLQPRLDCSSEMSDLSVWLTLRGLHNILREMHGCDFTFIVANQQFRCPSFIANVY
jgi:hypothetical protein